ncbi:MAG: hypothetical protein GMKNLPBB_02390 [Myxococcota bacterium]|nr:hypothetical protein [Myxococcota bacterium]
MMVVPGLECLLERQRGLVAGKRVALLVNPTAITRRFEHAADLWRRSSDLGLEVIFGPEHGAFATAQDMIPVEGEQAHAPVVSLYGDSLEKCYPPEEWMKRVHAVVYDIQDVGSRYYTFVASLLMTMEIAQKTGAEVIVCDRPNPVSGLYPEGGKIETGFESFVGYVSIAQRHAMTAGEIASLFRDRKTPQCRLTVVEMEGYRRRMFFGDTGLPWVMPSPNMPTPDTALVYPGMCLVEGTNLSEGRGTTRPFEITGAPWINGELLARGLNELNLPGVFFRPLSFSPTFQKHAGELCGGVQLHVTDREKFRPFAAGLALIRQARQMWPDQFRWRTARYEFVEDIPAFDLLAGNSWCRAMIDAGEPLDRIVDRFQSDLPLLEAERRHYLRYPE